MGIAIVIALVSSYHCQRVEPDDLLILTTDTIEAIGDHNYKFHGRIISPGNEEITQHGFCWADHINPTIEDSVSREGPIDKKGKFSTTISGLSRSTTYYVRSYAETGNGGVEYAGTERSLTTPEPDPPQLTTNPVADIDIASVTTGGEITYDGGVAITERGVCWDTVANPSVENNRVASPDNSDNFTVSLTGLTCDTEYHVRAYAVNSAGTSYGNDMAFSTAGCPISLPTVETVEVSDVTKTAAVSGGEITDNGGDSITARGICWSTSPEPDTSDQCTSDGTGMGIFASNMEELDCNTTYYVRAYATNDAGTAYGNQESFTTSVCFVSPATLITYAADGIMENEAISGGEVTDDGGGTIFNKGVCWSTTPQPTIITGDTVGAGPGIGPFSSHITGLECGTRYYVRAWATNESGTSYGPQEFFLTTSCVAAPRVITDDITGLTTTSVICGGNVYDDGGETVVDKGICWSTTPNPDIYSNRIPAGTGTGAFPGVTITGLSPGTTYYVRAYGTNDSNKTGYGEVKRFRTWDGSVTDFDGNVYGTVVIGSQTWMAENLKSVHFADGTPIPQVHNHTTWQQMDTTLAFACSWFFGDTTLWNNYGVLYTWAAAMNGAEASSYYPSGVKGVCPDGWHLPSDVEWKTLEIQLGMGEAESEKIDVFRGTNEGGKLKDTRELFWSTPNTGATNESGFTAIGSGIRSLNSSYDHLDTRSYYWTTDENLPTHAMMRELRHNYEAIYRSGFEKKNGMSVRCVKDY